MTQPPALQYSSPVQERSARPHGTLFLVFAILGMVIGLGRVLLGAFVLIALFADSESDVPTDYLAFSIASLLLAAALLVGSILSLWRLPVARKLIVAAAIFDTIAPVMLVLGMLAQLSTGYGDSVTFIWMIVVVRFAQGLTWWLVYRVCPNFRG